MAKISNITINNIKYDISAKAENIKTTSGENLQAVLNAINAMHDNHFLGIFVGNTVNSALTEAKNYYSQQMTSGSVVWFLAGTDLSELYAYLYKGFADPQKLSNNRYDFTDYESIKTDIAQIKSDILTHTTALNTLLEDITEIEESLEDSSRWGVETQTDTTGANVTRIDGSGNNHVVFTIPMVQPSVNEPGLMSGADKIKLNATKKSRVLTDTEYNYLDSQDLIDLDTIYYITED